MRFPVKKNHATILKLREQAQALAQSLGGSNGKSAVSLIEEKLHEVYEWGVIDEKMGDWADESGAVLEAHDPTGIRTPVGCGPNS